MRFKDADWNLEPGLGLHDVQTWEQAGIAVLMDLRDELKAIRRNTDPLTCRNAADIPRILRGIRNNTKARPRLPHRRIVARARQMRRGA